jgi:hypothetical protein
MFGLSACKERMLAYLLASLAKCMAMLLGSKEHYLGERCGNLKADASASKTDMDCLSCPWYDSHASALLP